MYETDPKDQAIAQLFLGPGSQVPLSDALVHSLIHSSSDTEEEMNGTFVCRGLRTFSLRVRTWEVEFKTSFYALISPSLIIIITGQSY